MATKTVITCDCCGRELQKGLFATVQIPRAVLASNRLNENAGGPSASEARKAQEIQSGGVSARAHDLCDVCMREYRVLIERFFTTCGDCAKWLPEGSASYIRTPRAHTLPDAVPHNFPKFD